jgi:hypothetical protein
MHEAAVQSTEQHHPTCALSRGFTAHILLRFELLNIIIIIIIITGVLYISVNPLLRVLSTYQEHCQPKTAHSNRFLQISFQADLFSIGKGQRFVGLLHFRQQYVIPSVSVFVITVQDIHGSTNE